MCTALDASSSADRSDIASGDSVLLPIRIWYGVVDVDDDPPLGLDVIPSSDGLDICGACVRAYGRGDREEQLLLD